MVGTHQGATIFGRTLKLFRWVMVGMVMFFLSEKILEKEVAMKVQSSEGKGVRSEYIFSKALESAQEDGVIPKDIHFAKAFEEDIGQDHYRYYRNGAISSEDGRPGKESYIFFMEKMSGKLEDLRCSTKEEQLQVMEKLFLDIEKLEEKGFLINDMHTDNIMLDKNNIPHFLDFGACKIQENGEAHDYIEKLRKENIYPDHVLDSLIEEGDYVEREAFIDGLEEYMKYLKRIGNDVPFKTLREYHSDPSEFRMDYAMAKTKFQIWVEEQNAQAYDNW